MRVPLVETILGKTRPVQNFEGERKSLVELLAQAGVRDAAVLRAVEDVPRHFFLPAEFQERAYENHPLPIGEGQTVSQPLMVALSAAALEVRPGDTVFEVGTGCGYQAAVLSKLAAEVHTVERIAALYTGAEALLRRLEFRNVFCYSGDGTKGLSAAAPFDAIFVSAASPSVPAPLTQELRPGGRLVIPIGNAEGQVLRRVRKQADGTLTVEDLMDVRYVPLFGKHGWPGDER